MKKLVHNTSLSAVYKSFSFLLPGSAEQNYLACRPVSVSSDILSRQSQLPVSPSVTGCHQPQQHQSRFKLVTDEEVDPEPENIIADHTEQPPFCEKI